MHNLQLQHIIYLIICVNFLPWTGYCTAFVRNRNTRPRYLLKSSTITFETRDGIGRSYKTTREGKNLTISLAKSNLNRSQAVLQLRVARLKVGERIILDEALKKFTKGSPEESLEKSAELRMVKNTLMLHAIKNTSFEGLKSRLKGPCLYLFVYNDELLPKMISTLKDLRRNNRELRRHCDIYCAAYSGTVLEAKDVWALHAISSKTATICGLLASISGCMQKVAAVMNNFSSRLAVALTMVAEKPVT